MTRLASNPSDSIIVVGAGAAGLMAARELARAGHSIIVLEAQDRCGGRIRSLPIADFGYPAEGGAEFIHGEAPVTHALLREADLSALPVHGARVRIGQGTRSVDDAPDAHTSRLRHALETMQSDLTVVEFLNRHFAEPEYEPLRRSILRMVESYDAADPAKASTWALRDEWMSNGTGDQMRIAGGYGAVIDFLAEECRRHGVTIHFNAAVTAIETSANGMLVHSHGVGPQAASAVVLAVPLPLLREISLPESARQKTAAAADIGFGNVVKILMRFRTRWWTETQLSRDDLSFVMSDKTIPVWWTQHPAADPVLTGWFGGPKTDGFADLGEDELIDTAFASLSDIFGIATRELKDKLLAARAINWARDPFARGAYSYATPRTRAAQAILKQPGDGTVFVSGEALYEGRDQGTVEAALASGLETARALLAGHAESAP